MDKITTQEFNELRYNRKHIDPKIRSEILINPQMMDKVEEGIVKLNAYINGTYYESKMKRVAQLKDIDLKELTLDVFVGVAYCQTPELFTSVTAQLAGRLGFSDKTEAITTVAEITAVLCYTDAFRIFKKNKYDSLWVESSIPLSHNLIDWIVHSQYLPPMVCAPNHLSSNYSSGYLTHNDSLILGSGNHHDGDICLDVLNTMNQVKLKLDTEFLSKCEEMPTFEFETPEQRIQWDTFKRQSYRFYSLIESQGNEMWFTYKVDKRGRIYSQGYHINPQGTGFKKAMVELHKEEFITGVPNV